MTATKFIYGEIPRQVKFFFYFRLRLTQLKFWRRACPLYHYVATEFNVCLLNVAASQNLEKLT